MLTVKRSKRRIEAITVVADFSDRMSSKETITEHVITMEVFAGDDISPADMLYLPPIVTAQTISQRVRWGVIGVVYNLQFQITTSSGDVLDQTTRVAVLPDAPDAIPQYMPLYFTSQPYPVNASDYMTGTGTVLSGRFLPHIIILPEWFASTEVITSGNLFGSAFTYSNPYEAISAAGLILDGNLYGGLVTYNNPYEGFLPVCIITSGDIFGGSVAYNNPYESISSVGTILSGTLI